MLHLQSCLSMDTFYICGFDYYLACRYKAESKSQLCICCRKKLIQNCQSMSSKLVSSLVTAFVFTSIYIFMCMISETEWCFLDSCWISVCMCSTWAVIWDCKLNICKVCTLSNLNEVDFGTYLKLEVWDSVRIFHSNSDSHLCFLACLLLKGCTDPGWIQQHNWQSKHLWYDLEILMNSGGFEPWTTHFTASVGCCV